MRLHLVGDGPQRAALAARVREAGLDDIVTFCGQQARAATLQALCDADVCVLPSLTESFCKARLDAMLCGTPVLTTDVGFGTEIVGASGPGAGLRGWVVEPGSAAALADALHGMLTAHQDWPALRRRCRDYVRRHTLEDWTARIGQLCASHWSLRLENGKLR
jgi:glycosyltransferase involved in cell wall biosynthesis